MLSRLFLRAFLCRFVCCGSVCHHIIISSERAGMSPLVNFCWPNCLIIKCHSSSLRRLPNWQRPQIGVKIAITWHTPTPKKAIWPLRKLAKTGERISAAAGGFLGGFTRCQNSCLADYVSWRCLCHRCCSCSVWKLLLIFHWTFSVYGVFLLRVSKRFSFELPNCVRVPEIYLKIMWKLYAGTAAATLLLYLILISILLCLV